MAWQRIGKGCSWTEEGLGHVGTTSNGGKGQFHPALAATLAATSFRHLHPPFQGFVHFVMQFIPLIPCLFLESRAMCSIAPARTNQVQQPTTQRVSFQYK